MWKPQDRCQEPILRTLDLGSQPFVPNAAVTLATFGAYDSCDFESQRKTQETCVHHISDLANARVFREKRKDHSDQALFPDFFQSQELDARVAGKIQKIRKIRKVDVRTYARVVNYFVFLMTL